jgi:hypothetical protein
MTTNGGNTPGSDAEPVAWVIPGNDNAQDNGFLDAMAFRSGEFTRPLYAHPKVAKYPGMTFEQVWEIKKSEGYQYGRDALENVRFGWDLAQQSIMCSDKESETAEPVAERDDKEVAVFMELVESSEELLAQVKRFCVEEGEWDFYTGRFYTRRVEPAIKAARALLAKGAA